MTEPKPKPESSASADLIIFGCVLVFLFGILTLIGYVYTLDHIQRADCIAHGGSWWGHGNNRGCIKIPTKDLPKQ